jgi:hypothetical protein
MVFVGSRSRLPYLEDPIAASASKSGMIKSNHRIPRRWQPFHVNEAFIEEARYRIN